MLNISVIYGAALRYEVPHFECNFETSAATLVILTSESIKLIDSLLGEICSDEGLTLETSALESL